MSPGGYALLVSKGTLALITLYIWFRALSCSKKGSFFGNTPWLWWLGIYVWGDTLILAPFWFISAIAWFFLPNQVVLLWLVAFHTVRSFFEVVYWLLHQATNKQYRPQLFINVTWLNSESVAIIYQLVHTCVVVLGLVLTFLLVGL